MNLKIALLTEATRLESKAQALRKAAGCLQDAAEAPGLPDTRPKPPRRASGQRRRYKGTRMTCSWPACGRGYISKHPLKTGPRAGRPCCSASCRSKLRRAQQPDPTADRVGTKPKATTLLRGDGLAP